VNTQVFDIQALLLVEAITMFDAGTQTPIVIDILSHLDAGQRDFGNRHELTIECPITGDQYPQMTIWARDADFEPAELNCLEAEFKKS